MRHDYCWVGTGEEAAGAGNVVVGAPGSAGEGGVAVAGEAGLAGGFGMYSGPGWPQPDTAAANAAAPRMSANEGFTIRMTV
jgi:hypothetical protein